MAQPLKVYGWMPMLRGKQLQAIIAAPSFAAFQRANKAAFKYGTTKDYVSETGNEQACEAALARPGVILVRGPNAYGEPYVTLEEWGEHESPT